MRIRAQVRVSARQLISICRLSMDRHRPTLDARVYTAKAYIALIYCACRTHIMVHSVASPVW